MPLTEWRLALGEQIAATIVLGEPVPKGRPRFNRITGVTFTPTTTRKAEAAMKARMDRVRPIRPVPFPLVLWLTFWCSSSSPADADNLGKLVADAGTGSWWENDRQIVEWHMRVFSRAVKPRTEIVATCLPR